MLSTNIVVNDCYLENKGNRSTGPRNYGVFNLYNITNHIIYETMVLCVQTYSSGQKSSCFSCVQRHFVSVPMVFRFRLPFPLRSIAESVPCTVNSGRIVQNKYTYVSCEYYS